MGRGKYGLMKISCIIVMLYPKLGNSKCEYEAILNFGDSNSDTGGFWAAFPAQSGPWGMTFFNKPTGRASDGRLVIDFFAQAMGMPFLSPYLQSIGSDYRHGANFATLASTVILPNTSLFVSGISPFSLAIQLNQFREFKVKVDEFHSSYSYPQGSRILPRPGIFGKSIYTIYIGQNDFTSNLGSIGVEGAKRYLPQVINQIIGAVKDIYGMGGRTFMVLNLAPVGCYPAILANMGRNQSDIDKYGCLISVNNAVAFYNKLLEEALTKSRAQFNNATIVYLDTNKLLLRLFRHPKSYGMRYGTKACCGYGGGPYNYDQRLFCGTTKVIDGRTETAMACTDPQNYVSFDGIHTTEAANRHISAAIIDGSIAHPPFALTQLCRLHTIP